MKIRDRYTTGVSGSRPVRGRDRLEGVGETSRTASAADRVQISGRSVEIQRARVVALQAPDIRQERVDEIVSMIERGEYRVTGRDVAPKLIREHLTDAMG